MINTEQEYYNGYSKNECIKGSILDSHIIDHCYRLVFEEPGRRPLMTAMAYEMPYNGQEIVIFYRKDKARLVQAWNMYYLHKRSCYDQVLEGNKHKPLFFSSISNKDLGRTMSTFIPVYAIMFALLPYKVYIHPEYVIKLKKNEVAQYEREHPDVVHMHEERIKLRYKYL
jgi:hypothetical protein